MKNYYVVVIIVFSLLWGVSEVAAEPLHIALVLWRGETPSEQGFKDGLQHLGISARYTVFDAQQDRKQLGEILFEELEPQLDEIDYVYTFGTTVTKITQNIIKGRVPQIFSIVSFPVQSQIVESFQVPGRNISGATHAVPVEQQIENAMAFLSFQRLGVLFNPREENSMLIRKNLYAIAEQEGFEVIDLRTLPDTKILEKNLQQLTTTAVSVDAVYLPSDSYLVSQGEYICPELNKAGIPTIAGIKKFIEYGALFGTVADYYSVGHMAAQLVARHQQGEAMGEIPVQTPQETTLLVNQKTLEHLGFELPQNLPVSIQFFE